MNTDYIRVLRGTEPIRYIWGDSLKELTHGAMKVKKPQNLPSESWRTRKPWCSNLEWKLGVEVVSPNMSLKVWEPGASKSKGKRSWSLQTSRDSEFTLPYFSQLFRPSMDWMVPNGTDEGDLLLCSLLIQMLISSGDAHTDTPQNNTLPGIWSSLSPLKLTQKINHTCMHMYLFSVTTVTSFDYVT